MALSILPDLEALDRLSTHARRWHEACDLLGLDREQDPRHTVFEPNPPPRYSLPDIVPDDDMDDCEKYERELAARLAAEKKLEQVQQRLRLAERQLAVLRAHQPAEALPALQGAKPRKAAVIDAPALEVSARPALPSAGETE